MAGAVKRRRGQWRPVCICGLRRHRPRAGVTVAAARAAGLGVWDAGAA